LGGRPILSLSFALNYAFGKYNVWGYHLVNLAIHILAALALYGIVRRTLLTGRLKEKFAPHSTAIAWITAAIWLVHPIQTESVTYIVQRAESLMGLFYLLTVYSAIRAMQPEYSRLWLILSVVFCALGMATKEVMVTAPLMVLLYDRAFMATAFTAAVKKRWPLYLGLAATWIVLAVVMTSAPRSDTVGFSVDIKPFDYAMNQCLSLVQYLKLCLWPRPLCLYYCWPVIRVWGLILPSLLMIAVMVAVTLWGFVRNLAWSYPLVWFFTILAPTSSFVPIADIIFEHRVYLSLAGLVIIAVTLGWLLLELITKQINLGKTKSWLGLGIATAAIVAMTTGTIYRNRDYQNGLSIWQSVVKAAPSSYKGHYNLGNQFKKQGEIDEAIKCYLKALKIKPDYVNGHLGLGNILKSQGRFKEAADHYRQILLKDPNHTEANFNLGVTSHLQGRLDRAVDYYRRAIELKPDYVGVHSNLGAALLSQGNFDEAVSHFNSALKIDPNNAGANNNLAYAIISRPNIDKNDITRAVELARRAAELTDYNNPEILETLADCYSKDGKADLAVQTAEKALELALPADNKQLIERIRSRLQLYKKQIP